MVFGNPDDSQNPDNDSIVVFDVFADHGILEEHDNPRSYNEIT